MYVREEERDGIARDVHDSRLPRLPIRREQTLDTAAKYLETIRLNIAVSRTRVCYHTEGLGKVYSSLVRLGIQQILDDTRKVIGILKITSYHSI